MDLSNDTITPLTITCTCGKQPALLTPMEAIFMVITGRDSQRYVHFFTKNRPCIEVTKANFTWSIANELD